MRSKNFIDLTGKKFGRLTVLSFDKTKNGRTYWKCKCSCGSKKSIEAYGLKTKTRSCGCLMRELTKKRNSKLYTTHGMTNTRIYYIWQQMRNRCQNPNNYHYQYYGKRGISVCSRWSSFERFLSDMLAEYEIHVSLHGVKNTTIDRKDVDGDYSPENCRWATYKAQNNNKRYDSKKMRENGLKGAKKRWGLPD